MWQCNELVPCLRAGQRLYPFSSTLFTVQCLQGIVGLAEHPRFTLRRFVASKARLISSCCYTSQYSCTRFPSFSCNFISIEKHVFIQREKFGDSSPLAQGVCVDNTCCWQGCPESHPGIEFGWNCFGFDEPTPGLLDIRWYVIHFLLIFINTNY